MTKEFLSRGSMDNHSEVTMLAKKLVSTVTTNECASGSATIKKKQAFFTFRHSFRNLLRQFVR
ncbi:hypothetical protein CO024_00385 [Candidatus Gracilibacteria bacterium CG_4_9_14_0_2_um_filter_38_7]|nr:MAG: hypothetical protein CO024_00385 [Candidatus Gracilibacteria bacterium CG_4_9_14_0_2_um_filter_38_7]